MSIELRTMRDVIAIAETGGFHMLPASVAGSLPAVLACLATLDALASAESKMTWRPGAWRPVEAVAAMARAL